MYNLIKYSKNSRKTTGSLQNYYRDEPNDTAASNYHADPTTIFASFKYKSNITGKTAVKRGTKKVEFAIPLNHLIILGEH